MTGQLSGEERRSRIEDLARGNHSQEELAEKYGITLQTMREFSARNADEIAARKAELQGELNAATVHLWVSEKAEILAYYKMMLDQLRPKLTDSGLDDRVRSRFNRDAKALLHDCSELEGLLQARSRVELEVTNAELPPPGTKWCR